jgi:hypothetical protein
MGWGADGEVRRDVVARREGKGRGGEGKTGLTGGARWEGAGGGGVASWDRDVARRGGVPDGGGGCARREGGLPDGMGWTAGRGFVGAERDGRVSKREGRRGPQGRVSEQRGRMKLAAWIMCTCGMLGPLVLHPVPHHWSRLY